MIAGQNPSNVGNMVAAQRRRRKHARDYGPLETVKYQLATEQIQVLTSLSWATGVPISEFVRRAVDGFLESAGPVNQAATGPAESTGEARGTGG